MFDINDPVNSFKLPDLYAVWSVLQQTNTTLTTNSTTSANLTHAQIARTFPQLTENALSISNSILYIIIYSILMAVMTGLLIKYKQEMKRNQKILYGLVFLCIITQYLGLIFRLVYNGQALSMNLSYRDYSREVARINQSKIILYIFSFLENMCVIFQTVNIIIVICFMQNLFLNTVKLSGAMTNGVYKVLKYTINIVSLICAVIMSIMVILNNVINLISKMQVTSLNVLPIIISIFLIFLLTVLTETVLFLGLGIRLLRVVRKTSLNVSQAKEQVSFLQRPEVKISGLIIGMLASAFIQVIAAVIAVITTSFASYLHILDYFAQAFGILVFAVFVLLLYNPLVAYGVGTNKSSAQQLDDVKTHSERTDSAQQSSGHNRQISSARIHKNTSNLSDAYERVASPSTTTTTTTATSTPVSSPVEQQSIGADSSNITKV